MMFQLLVLSACIGRFSAVENGFEFGKKLPCEAFLILNMYGLKQCFSECQTYSICLSINYDRKHLVCELNSVRKNASLLLVNKDDFVYRERTDQVSPQCGSNSCDPGSKCVQTTTDKSACIPSVCNDPIPEVENGTIASRTYTPASVTYLCNPGLVSEESKTFHCVPGKGWGITKYSCILDFPWEQYGGRQYCFVTNLTLAWDAAKNVCDQLNAHLVEIQHQEEQNWIHSQINGHATPFWIGLTDAGSEGDWYWEHTRQTPNISAWDISDGQPSGGTTENCAVLYMSNTLHDYPCVWSFPFICKK